MSAKIAPIFLAAAADWIVDGGSLQICFLAGQRERVTSLIDASLSFGPRKLTREVDFVVKASNLIAGQRTFPSIPRAKALEIVQSAIFGQIQFDSLRLKLEGMESHTPYSETFQRDRWAGELHLQLSGEAWPDQVSTSELAAQDNLLRVANPPFDGITELTQVLRLADTRLTHQRPSIGLRIGMPADLLLNDLRLSGNRLHLSFIAHTKFDQKKLSVAVRGFPGKGLSTRQQVAHAIQWKRAKNNFKQGKLDLQFENTDSAILMVTYAGQLVRRQWVIDPEKAINARLVAMQAFDKDLKQLRQALFESTDAVKFEQGVAALLFLLGFNPSPVLETQAPDILLATPSGAIAVVECTTRTSDFNSKIGKLVDRRQLLTTQLAASGHARRIQAFLVSSQTRAQVAAELQRVAALNVTLLTREDIVQGISQTRLPLNPDKLLDDAAQRLTTEAAAVSSS
jgi:hypothetical protein